MVSASNTNLAASNFCLSNQKHACFLLVNSRYFCTPSISKCPRSPERSTAVGPSVITGGRQGHRCTSCAPMLKVINHLECLQAPAMSSYAVLPRFEMPFAYLEVRPLLPFLQRPPLQARVRRQTNQQTHMLNWLTHAQPAEWHQHTLGR